MRKKLGLVAMLVALMTVMAGCFDVNQPINADSEGIWNSYFVYPLSWLIIYIAEPWEKATACQLLL